MAPARPRSRTWSLAALAHLANFFIEFVGAVMVYLVQVPGMRQVYEHNVDARRLLPLMGLGMQGTVAVLSLAVLVTRETDSFSPLVVLMYYHIVNVLIFAGPAFHGVKFHEISDPKVAFGIHLGLLVFCIAGWVDLYDYVRTEEERGKDL